VSAFIEELLSQEKPFFENNTKKEYQKIANPVL
jgi:hypothetical protein